MFAHIFVYDTQYRNKVCVIVTEDDSVKGAREALAKSLDRSITYVFEYWNHSRSKEIKVGDCIVEVVHPNVKVDIRHEKR